MDSYDEMTDEEIAAMYERLSRELATRQSRAAIERELTAAVDRIVQDNPDVMGETFATGRLQVAPARVTVKRPDDE